jgi:hypothetical protein
MMQELFDTFFAQQYAQELSHVLAVMLSSTQDYFEVCALKSQLVHDASAVH